MTSKRQRNAGYPLPPTVETTETMSICLTFPYTTEYRDALLGAILTLTKWYNWEKSYTVGDDRATRAAQLWRDTMTYKWLDNCDGGADMPSIFRENPLDTCEVQYSNDNGVTWNTMFRKDNCAPLPGGDSIYQTETNIETITNNNIIYNTDITNIAPEWEYDPLITDAALCWAVRKFVDAICDFRLSQLSDNSGLLTVSRFAENGLKIFTAICTGLAASTGNVVAAAASAASWALADRGFDIINASLSNDRELYEDGDAREIVACWMLGNLRGETPQFADWQSALDDFTGGNEAEDAIVAIVSVALSDEDLYVNYLLSVESVNDIAESLPECPCPTRWSHEWDFENVGLEAWTVDDWGNYVEGVGIIGEKNDNAYASLLVAGLRLNEEIPRCDGWSFTSTLVRGSFDSNIDSCLVMRNPPQPERSDGQSYIVTGTFEHSNQFALSTLEYVELVRIRSSWTQSGVPGSVVVTSAKLQGEGVDPFRHRITYTEEE